MSLTIIATRLDVLAESTSRVAQLENRGHAINDLIGAGWVDIAAKLRDREYDADSLRGWARMMRGEV